MREKKSLLKQRTARLAVIVAFSLAILKLVAGVVTNSISIIATAVDSIMDMLASGVNFFSIRKSDQPADDDHAYGHGKAESLAGLFQSIVIALSGIYLIIEGVKRSIYGAEIGMLNMGLVVMAISIAISFLLSRRLIAIARQTDSIALRADSLHYSADVYANLAAILALVVIKFTGYTIVDAVVSIAIASYIIWSALKVLIESIDVLMDKELPDDVRSEIRSVLGKYYPEIIGFHNLRTRKSGSKKFIDFRLFVKKESSFERSHYITEKVAKEIEERISDSDVLIHTDPF